jgi:hypothetical protein
LRVAVRYPNKEKKELSYLSVWPWLWPSDDSFQDRCLGI